MAFSKIGIIGAGISGLAAAKQLASHQPMVFEATIPSEGCGNIFVSFNSKVVEIRFVGHDINVLGGGGLGEGLSAAVSQPIWEVAVQTDQSDTVQWHAFEFLVICTGKYGDVPKIPDFPHNKGPEVFGGKVLHTLDYSKLEKEEATQLLQGKKVVVIGYKKSAIDFAVECAESNQGPEGQTCTMVVRTLHWTVPHYWRRSISKIIESYLAWKLPLNKYGLKPDHPFEEDYASCQMAILPENFFSEADKGKIAFKNSTSKWWFWEGGVEFEDKTKLEADVVVLATELRCKWLARLIDNQFKLPAWRRCSSKPQRDGNHEENNKILQKKLHFYFQINHSDEICQEMGWSSWRKKSWFSEAFSPYMSQDYQEEI
ncbi:hypothetical protein C3L33_03501, partial [Rhododendron williamsianum]